DASRLGLREQWTQHLQEAAGLERTVQGVAVAEPPPRVGQRGRPHVGDAVGVALDVDAGSRSHSGDYGRPHLERTHFLQTLFDAELTLDAIRRLVVLAKLRVPPATLLSPCCRAPASALRGPIGAALQWPQRQLMPALVGRTLAHFRILSKLGEGGMGVVYRARDEGLQRTVALKVLPPDVAGDEARRDRFLREARAAAAISHPAIATIHQI